MTKKKKLVKEALSNPELYTSGEISFFQLWLKERKERKEQKKEEKRSFLEWLFRKNSIK